MTTRRKPPTLIDALREAIAASGKSLKSLADDAEIYPGELSRFTAGQRDLGLATADPLATTLGLTLTAAGPKQSSE